MPIKILQLIFNDLFNTIPLLHVFVYLHTMHIINASINVILKKTKSSKISYIYKMWNVNLKQIDNAFY